MEHNAFVVQIERLRGTYGNGVYPPERVKMLWEKFQGASGAVLERAVSFLILNSQKAPMGKELEEALVEARRSLESDKKFLPSPTGCRDCDGGLRFEIREGLSYVFRCLCDAGRKQNQAIPQFEYRP